MKLYRMCVQSFKWSLKELDETDFDTLVEFLFFEEKADPNTRVIGGKTYKRATAAPNWL
ncbi:MAG: hypothetical protein VB078_00455 [Clostridiaceae bacterium]|nr:hypothetical protein [Clostridiaceae bacterium]